MMIKKFLSLLSIAILLFSVSCQKDKEEADVEEAKETMDELVLTMEDDMNIVMDGDAMQALESFGEAVSIDDPVFGASKKSTFSKLALSSLSDLKNLRAGDEPTSLEDYAGTYTWNSTNQGWVIVQNDPADKVIFIFPVLGPASDVNDATIIIRDYDEVKITETDEWGTYEYYNPTLISAELQINETKLVDLTASMVWEETTGEMNDFDGSLFFSPYTITLDLSNSDNSATIVSSFEEGNTLISSCNLSVDFVEDEFRDMEPDYVEGYIQYRKIQLKGNINIGEINDFRVEYTEEDYNDHVNLALYTYPDGNKFADIVFKYDAEYEEIMPYIVYIDGTEVNALVFMQDIFESLGDLAPTQVLK
jgi:hypothetical protein